MGDGPCGPCTEIFYDLSEQGLSPTEKLTIDDLESKRFIEIGNIVFSEFYHQGDDYLPLSQKCVDFGGGLERTVMVLQDKKNAFQIDLWQEVIKLVSQIDKKNNLGHDDKSQGNYYIIADHLRTTIFALADGAGFGPKGRGYILKKLVKRATLLGYFLNFAPEDLLAISQKLIEVNSSFYTHLKVKEKMIIASLEKEITYVMRFVKEATQKIDKYCQKNLPEIIPAADIFLWYDTYGIPRELIEYHLKQKGYRFSEPEFNKLLEEQKQRGKEDREKKKVAVF